MRVYALVVLVSALLLLAFYDAFAKKPPSAASAIGYAACVAIALYTQYYLAFLIAAQGITVAIYYRRLLLRYAIAAAAGALAFVPMLAVIPGQVQNFKDGFAAPSPAHAAAGLAGILLRYVLPLPVLHSKLFYVAIVAVVAVALLVVRPQRSSEGSGSILVTTACARGAICRRHLRIRSSRAGQACGLALPAEHHRHLRPVFVSAGAAAQPGDPGMVLPGRVAVGARTGTNVCRLSETRRLAEGRGLHSGPRGPRGADRRLRGGELAPVFLLLSRPKRRRSGPSRGRFPALPGVPFRDPRRRRSSPGSCRRAGESGWSRLGRALRPTSSSAVRSWRGTSRGAIGSTPTPSSSARRSACWSLEATSRQLIETFRVSRRHIRPGRCTLGVRSP